MKKLFSLFLFFILCESAFAQSEHLLSGTVVDAKGEAVGFANVAVLELATSKVVTGAIAGMDGQFKIKMPAAGDYQLQISAVGYAAYKTAPFQITASSVSKDFGKLQVKEDAQTLGEVEVLSLRPNIVTHPDKMVVSVEGTAMASGSTAYEVLSKSPGVWIDQDGNLQLNGKAGVQIMINGKRSYLSGKELQNLLQGMSAENIKELEIITNPSSRFDAEGASGVININLKKQQQAGMNGSVNAGYQYNNYSSYTGGAEISHKSGQWNSFGSIDFAERVRYRDASMNRIFTNENGSKSKYDQKIFEEGKRTQPSLRIGTDYDLNERHSIGAMANLSFNSNSNSFETDSYLRDGEAANDLYIYSYNHSKGSYQNGTFNVHYLGKLDTAGTTLSADLDYVTISSHDDFDFTNRYMPLNNTAAQTHELLLSTNPVHYDIYSAKIDFAKPLHKTTKLELGVKASQVTSDNDLSFYVTNGDQKTIDPDRSNHFIYKERIYAAYANVSASIHKRLSIQGGVRAEHTSSTGTSLNYMQPTVRNYLNLFPSIFVQQHVSENYQISYKYSLRINRPNYQNLNPFIFYLDPYTSIQGNPNLRPQYVNSFELAQTFRKTYNLVIGYAYTRDFMAEIPNQNAETNTTVFQQQNIKSLESINATLVLPVRISGKWDINNNIIGMYQEYASFAEGKPVMNSQVTLIAQSNHTIVLPHGLRLEVNGAYQSPTVYGLYRMQDQAWIDAGLKRSFLNDKLTATLYASDIFRSRIMHVEAELNGNVNAIDQYHGARAVRFSLRYRFNKGSEFQARKRNVNLDELNRTGGN
ncbi:TonB-dependent receptor domain-containing protein [Pontibacter sp. SGAir0037]|uniref:TonB-dependent receptor domain-containing protein n=1 Tax=Pontibacter sp. SGAir0037 TaxID=2571030 RepID=UPI0010CCE4F7|nr:TonB-dependent receptor [Pontibacter sp. SGAir0037]QCR22067.1 TonB-dependent receptor [Pontibacter sp. SGAir0037]